MKIKVIAAIEKDIEKKFKDKYMKKKTLEIEQESEESKEEKDSFYELDQYAEKHKTNRLEPFWHPQL